VQCSNGSEIKIIVYENDYEHCMQCAFTTENCDKNASSSRHKHSIVMRAVKFLCMINFQMVWNYFLWIYCWIFNDVCGAVS